MAKPQKTIGLNPKQSFHENARIILPQRVAEVYRWEQFIQNPERREELHNMRISIKRLRYTMEFFAANYDKDFIDFIDTTIELQDIIGDIHDSDVVLAVLTEYKNTQQTDVMRGVDTLITRTREMRNADYERFLKRWEELSTTNFKQKLLTIIAS